MRPKEGQEEVFWFLTLPQNAIVLWNTLALETVIAAARLLSSKRPRWFEIEYPPACAPELNPVEYIWANVKFRKLSNFIPKDLDHLEGRVSASLDAVTIDIIKSEFQHAGLSLKIVYPMSARFNNVFVGCFLRLQVVPTSRQLALFRISFGQSRTATPMPIPRFGTREKTCLPTPR